MSAKQRYEQTVKDILEFTGGARHLTVTQIAKYLGRGRNYVYDHYGLAAHGGMTVFELAKILTEE